MIDPKHISFQQACEQIGAAGKDFAPVLGNYFHALLAEGFERPEALILARDWQRILFRQTQTQGEDN